MSRWRSPQSAAKRAQRTAKDAEQRRKDRRKLRFMIAGFLTVSLGLTVADYFWMRARAARRQEEYHRTHHRQPQTNSPAAPVDGGRKTNDNIIP